MVALKMSYRIVCTLIITVITFLSIVERVRSDDYSNFVCEKVITDISKCERSSCPTEGVRMLKKCDSRYKNDLSIKRKCEEWSTVENQLRNHFLTLPVVNAKKGIAYWNMYCALCNYDDEFEFEDPVLLPSTVERCGLSTFLNFNFALNKSITSKYTNALCYGDTSRIIRKDLVKSDYHCREMLHNSESHDPAHHTTGKYCSIDPSMHCPKLPFRHDLFCTYGSEFGKFCQYDAFLFNGISFAYGENGDVYVPLHYKHKFTRDEYSNLTGIEGVIYVCGDERHHTYFPLKMALILSYFISIVFYILCIMLNSNKQSLQNLPNRTLYSFCISALMYSLFRLNNELTIIEESCITTDLIFEFTSTSALLWNLVVLFEYSRVLYALIRNLDLNVEAEMKKYLVYCFVCWVLPAIPTIFPLFFILMGDEKPSTCPKITAYSLVYCGYDEKSHKYVSVLFKIFDSLESVCGKIITLWFFVMVAAIIYLYKRNNFRSNEKNFSVMFRKTALVCLIISFPFALHLFAGIFERAKLLHDIFGIFNGLEGVFIFFCCYYEKNILSKILATCGLKKNPSPENIEIYDQV